VLPLLVTANVVPSSSILVTVMMEAIRSSETQVRIRAMRRNTLEDGVLRTHVFVTWFINQKNNLGK
jgi:cellobiose-specific phosphotransferase system component IIB